MPSEPRRLHGFTVVSRALRLARRLILPAILGGASVGDDFGSVLFWVVLILSLPSIVVAAAQWLVFRYRLEGDELILDSGVLARRRRVIPIDRIQNVDLEQSPLERLARVAELRIETASGGRETEAGLTVLALADARALQGELLRRRAAARGRAPADDPTPVGELPMDERLLRLSAADLALAGATSNEAGLIAAGLATLLELGMRFGALEGLAARVDDVIEAGAGIGWAGAVTAIALLAILFLVLGWLVSIVASVVRFHGFTLARAGSDLRREYGLLSRHHATVPLERVQAVRVEETLLRRALGLVTLKIETAGAGPQERSGAGGAEAYVPIARRREVGRLLREVFPDARFDEVRLEPVAPPSRRREFVRISMIILGVAAGLAAISQPRLLLLLGLVIPGWFLAGARYRARGWARAGEYVLARSGVLTRTTWVVPDRKIQTLHVRETPFQRRWNLATLLVDTAAAGRPASVVDLHHDTAMGLLAHLARDAELARGRAALRAR